MRRPGPILLRKFVRGSKTDDLVQRVELIEANPMYARIRYPDGRESNVSLRDIARLPCDKQSTSVEDHDIQSAEDDNVRFENNGEQRLLEEDVQRSTDHGDERLENDGVERSVDFGGQQSASGDDVPTTNGNGVRSQHDGGERYANDNVQMADDSERSYDNELARSSMPRRPRRSLRVNKGVPPLRYDDLANNHY